PPRPFRAAGSRERLLACGCGGGPPSKAEACAEDRSAEVHVPDEAAVLVIHLEVAVAGPGREPVAELVAGRAQKLPSRVRGDAETADVGGTGDEEAAAEPRVPAEADKGVRPEFIFSGLTPRQ